MLTHGFVRLLRSHCGPSFFHISCGNGFYISSKLAGREELHIISTTDLSNKNSTGLCVAVRAPQTSIPRVLLSDWLCIPVAQPGSMGLLHAAAVLCGLSEWSQVAAVLTEGALKCVFWLLSSWGVWLFEKALFVTFSLYPGLTLALAFGLYLGFYSSGSCPLAFRLMDFGCQIVSCSSLVFWLQILALAASCSLALKSYLCLWSFFPKSSIIPIFLYQPLYRWVKTLANRAALLLLSKCIVSLVVTQVRTQSCWDTLPFDLYSTQGVPGLPLHSPHLSGCLLVSVQETGSLSAPDGCWKSAAWTDGPKAKHAQVWVPVACLLEICCWNTNL